MTVDKLIIHNNVINPLHRIFNKKVACILVLKQEIDERKPKIGPMVPAVTVMMIDKNPF